MNILYSNADLFRLAMAAAYRQHRHERFSLVAEWIPPGTEVLDVCCGAGTLAGYLPRSVRYRGLDQSRSLIATARRRGLNAEQFDVHRDPVPATPVVVCQISLYQFHPGVEHVLYRLFTAAQRRLIVSESVRSLAQSSFPPARWLGIRALQVQGMTHKEYRFTAKTIHDLFEPYEAYLRYSSRICGGREWMFVLDKTEHRTEA